jgi:hypothetical protein
MTEMEFRLQPGPGLRRSSKKRTKNDSAPMKTITTIITIGRAPAAAARSWRFPMDDQIL